MSRYNADISIDNNYNSFLHLEIKMISNKKLRHIRLIIDFHLILLSVPTLGRLMSLFSIELINHCSKRRRHQRFFLYFSKYFMHHIIWADFFLSVFFLNINHSIEIHIHFKYICEETSSIYNSLILMYPNLRSLYSWSLFPLILNLDLKQCVTENGITVITYIWLKSWCQIFLFFFFFFNIETVKLKYIGWEALVHYILYCFMLGQNVPTEYISLSCQERFSFFF